MNNSKGAFLRYKLIDAMVRNPYKPYPTMDEILASCYEKFEVSFSSETIRKDIKNMRLPHPEGFDAPIKFHRKHQGYYYTNKDFTITSVSLRTEEIDAIEQAVELIRAIGDSRISEQFNAAIDRLMSATKDYYPSSGQVVPTLQLMTPPKSNGFQHFEFFYKAAKERKPVSFLHFSYQQRIFKHVLIHPFLVKEFENRWYVVGYSENHGEIRTFGFDRISFPIFLKQPFIAVSPEVKRNFFKDMYGVFPLGERVVQRVVIHADKLSTHYFKAYPIHESQEIIKYSSGTSKITFNLIPTMELARYFRMQSKEVRVISPRWFAEYVYSNTHLLK